MTRVPTASTLWDRYSGSLYISKERGVAPLHIFSHDYSMVSIQRHGHTQVST